MRWCVREAERDRVLMRISKRATTKPFFIIYIGYAKIICIRQHKFVSKQYCLFKSHFYNIMAIYTAFWRSFKIVSNSLIAASITLFCWAAKVPVRYQINCAGKFYIYLKLNFDFSFDWGRFWRRGGIQGWISFREGHIGARNSFNPMGAGLVGLCQWNTGDNYNKESKSDELLDKDFKMCQWLSVYLSVLASTLVKQLIIWI